MTTEARGEVSVQVREELGIERGGNFEVKSGKRDKDQKGKRPQSSFCE
jgi:hypothetical protein